MYTVLKHGLGGMALVLNKTTANAAASGLLCIVLVSQ